MFGGKLGGGWGCCWAGYAVLPGLLVGVSKAGELEGLRGLTLVIVKLSKRGLRMSYRDLFIGLLLWHDVGGVAGRTRGSGSSGPEVSGLGI